MIILLFFPCLIYSLCPTDYVLSCVDPKMYPVLGIDECNKSCTCESNKYLDILCGCDYTKKDFVYTSCKPRMTFYDMIANDRYFTVLCLSITIASTAVFTVALCVIQLIYMYRDHLERKHASLINVKNV